MCFSTAMFDNLAQWALERKKVMIYNLFFLWICHIYDLYNEKPLLLSLILDFSM